MMYINAVGLMPFAFLAFAIWLLIVAYEFFTVPSKKVKPESQKRAKNYLRYSLLGIFVILTAIIAYVVTWNVFIKSPVGENIEYELPSDYHWATSQYLGGVNILVNQDFDSSRIGNKRPVIMIASAPSYFNFNEENIRLQILSSMERSPSTKQSYEMTLIDEQEINIRGQLVPLLIYEGIDENGAQMKQFVSGSFAGENSKVMLLIFGEEAY